MTASLSIRKEPDGNAAFVMYKDIPLEKRSLFKKGKQGQAIIKKGIKTKCLGEKQIGTRGVYMKISRGWILAQYKGKNRVEEV